MNNIIIAPEVHPNMAAILCFNLEYVAPNRQLMANNIKAIFIFFVLNYTPDMG